MNFRGLLLTALCVTGPTLSPAVAQLIHISVNNLFDAHLLFKTDDSRIPWNTSWGYITQLDFTFNSEQKVGALDPGRNYYRMRVENPSLGRNFTFTQAFQTVTAGEQYLAFETLVVRSNLFLDVELDLVFDSLIPTDGSLPKFPLPALGTMDYFQSQFSFHSGNAPFNVPHLAEAYGGAALKSITATMTPIPEPSVYGLAGLALIGAAIGARRGIRGGTAKLRIKRFEFES